MNDLCVGSCSHAEAGFGWTQAFGFAQKRLCVSVGAQLCHRLPLRDLLLWIRRSQSCVSFCGVGCLHFLGVEGSVFKRSLAIQLCL